MGKAKGTVSKSSIVVDFMQMRADWEAKVPSRHEREFDCRIRNGSYSTFASRAQPSKLYDGCGTTKMETYIKWIEASGLDINKYVRDDLDPRDYIIRKTPKEVAEPSEVPAPTEPEVSPNTCTEDEPNVVIFEKPGKKPSQNTTPSPKFRSVPNIPIGTTIIRPADSEIPEYVPPKKTGYIRTVKKSEGSKRKNPTATTKFNKLNLKMQRFVTHLPMYLCALHLSADNVICDTSITNFREIRDGKVRIELYDYIVLSDYFVDMYSRCTCEDYKDMFDQVARCFNDIYISTLYYNDSGDDT